LLQDSRQGFVMGRSNFPGSSSAGSVLIAHHKTLTNQFTPELYAKCRKIFVLSGKIDILRMLI
jgi:hypothetical protein